MKTNASFAKVKVRKGDSVAEYKSKQFHIHAPSEHMVNDKIYDAEIHIVCQVEDDDKDKVGAY